MSRICMIGTGYVGLVTGACIADFGNDVICVDIDKSRVARLRGGEIPIYELGLGEIIARSVAAGRIEFTTDLGASVARSDVVFIAVGTPPLPDGGTDLTHVMDAARSLAAHIDGYTVIVQKSTAPVGTARRVAEVVAKAAPAHAEFDVVSNPEFLREGSAIGDFMRPNRVVIGAESERAREMMRQIYGPLYLLETPIVNTTLESAEMIKYASNAFLATKISFINEMATICELVGANVDDVARGMGFDGRIGRKFLHAGIGYGGSCLPKDLSSLLHTARENGYDAPLIGAAHGVNAGLVERAITKLKKGLGELGGKTVAVLGLSFKPNTDDVREAPSLHIIERLHAAGATVKAFDPIAADNFRASGTGNGAELCASAYDAAEGADAVMLVTEWNEFRELDLERLRGLMQGRTFVDCRNVYARGRMTELGFDYHSFGRGAPQE